MATKKKLIELDVKAIAILERQAKLQKRSLKNYIEYLLEDKAEYFAEPTEEYKKMIDDMLEREAKGEVKWHSSEDIRKQYGK